MGQRTNRSPVWHALVMYVVWTAGTWLFEGRIKTLMRPDAVADRLVYAVVINLLLGIVGGVWLLGWLGRQKGVPTRRLTGFGGGWRLPLSITIGFTLGLAVYVLQGAPSTNPVVITNAFAQVFVVSAAEVIVCWALVGTTVEAVLLPRMGRVGTLCAAAVSAVLFGVYHYAHSPPFNSASMVWLLTIVGLVTGAFFFLSRDVLGTAVFHNFLGTYGVTQALVAGGRIETLEALQMPLIGTAVTTTAVVVAGYWWLRHGR